MITALRIESVCVCVSAVAHVRLLHDKVLRWLRHTIEPSYAITIIVTVTVRTCVLPPHWCVVLRATLCPTVILARKVGRCVHPLDQRQDKTRRSFCALMTATLECSLKTATTSFPAIR